MRNQIRAAVVAAAAVALAGLGCVAAGASVQVPAPSSRLHDALAHDAASLPGSGQHSLSIVTLYAPPTSTDWTTVEGSAGTAAGAIVNVCDDPSTGNDDGPGCNNTDWTAKNTAWDATVSALQAAGITPLIYITTDNGANSIATVENELSQAKQWWGIATPMFDQMVGTEGTANNGSGICTDGGANISCHSYYEQLYTYAMAGGAQAVMFNPGTWYGMSPAFMYGPDEILQGFEDTETALQKNANPAPSWADSYGEFQFSATVSEGTQPQLATDVSDAAADQHAGFVYETEETAPPGYGALPPWFAAFLTDLQGGSLAYPAALSPVQASRKSGYCLDNTGNSSSNGNHIQVWKCLGNVNQQWEYVPSLDGVSGQFQLQNSNGKCLDDPNDSTANGTRVQLWTCLGNPNQEWTAHAVDGSYTEYVNANGLCLNNTGNATKNGNRVQVWACNSEAAQSWSGPSLDG
jgi:hypothetical protein